MGQKIRTFVAVEISAAVRDRVAELIDEFNARTGVLEEL